MVKFSEDALNYIRGKDSSVFIDVPSFKSACCCAVGEPPAVRFGKPSDISAYTRQEAQGVTLYIPNCIQAHESLTSLTIDTQNFLGFRTLVLDGWKLI